MSDRIAYQPVERRARVVAAEVALTAATAYLVGVCAAVTAAAGQAPGVQLVFATAGIGLALAYGLWLLGGSGVPLAVLNLPLLILAMDALLVDSGIFDLGPGAGLLDPALSGVVPALLAVVAAGTGLACGLMLPGPRRLRLTHGVHHEQVNSAAVLSEGAVMERLRSAPQAGRSAPGARDTVWFDQSTEDDHVRATVADSPSQPDAQRRPSLAAPRPGGLRAAQVGRLPDPVPEPDPDPGPDPMPAPDPMPEPDPMPQPDPDGYAERRDAEDRASRDSVRLEQHLQ